MSKFIKILNNVEELDLSISSDENNLEANTIACHKDINILSNKQISNQIKEQQIFINTFIEGCKGASLQDNLKDMSDISDIEKSKNYGSSNNQPDIGIDIEVA